jgi:arginase
MLIRIRWFYSSIDDPSCRSADYHLDGGLCFSDLSELLKIILSSGRTVGMDITILNPCLDVDGSITRRFVSSVVSGLL